MIERVEVTGKDALEQVRAYIEESAEERGTVKRQKGWDGFKSREQPNGARIVLVTKFFPWRGSERRGSLEEEGGAKEGHSGRGGAGSRAAHWMSPRGCSNAPTLKVGEKIVDKATFTRFFDKDGLRSHNLPAKTSIDLACLTALKVALRSTLQRCLLATIPRGCKGRGFPGLSWRGEIIGEPASQRRFGGKSECSTVEKRKAA